MVASVNLGNHFAATGAGLGIFANEGGGGERIGGTGVGRISVGALDFKAVGAGPEAAQAALPGAREESVTAVRRTAANELGGGGSRRGSARGGLLSAGPHILDSVPEGRSLL